MELNVGDVVKLKSKLVTVWWIGGDTFSDRDGNTYHKNDIKRLEYKNDTLTATVDELKTPPCCGHNKETEKYEHFEETKVPSAVNPSHYNQDKKYDVYSFAIHNNLGMLEGNVVKYVSRHDKKNGKEDLLKAIETIQRIIKEKYDI